MARLAKPYALRAIKTLCTPPPTHCAPCKAKRATKGLAHDAEALRISDINERIDVHVACEEPRTRRVMDYLTKAARGAKLGGQDGGEPQEASPEGGQNVRKDAKSRAVTLVIPMRFELAPHFAPYAELIAQDLKTLMQEALDAFEADALYKDSAYHASLRSRTGDFEDATKAQDRLNGAL